MYLRGMQSINACTIIAISGTAEEEDRLLGSGRMEYVGELRNSLLNYQRQTSQATLGDYLQQISLITSTEDHETEQATVSLMTVHNAKGLEFETVIIAGFEKDLFPHFLAERDGDISEERRLFYVGMTRAKETLTLSYCRVRSRYGREESPEPSRFLKEMPASEVRWVGKDEKTVKTAEEKAAAARPHLDALKALLGA